MQIQQLNPAIPVEVRGQGPAEAVALFDYGQDQDLMWLVFILENGQSMFAYGRDIKRAGHSFETSS